MARKWRCTLTIFASPLYSPVSHDRAFHRDLSIAENVFMHREPKTSYGWIDYAEMNRSVAKHLNQLGVSLRPDDPVLGLSIADQQIVEIIKALTFQTKVLIMDSQLAKEEMAVMMISSDLSEVIAVLVPGQSVIILMRQIDLSISSIVGITSFPSGTLFVNHPGIPNVVVARSDGGLCEGNGKQLRAAPC